MNVPVRIVLIIPDPGLVAVGVVDDGSLTVHLLQAIGVEFCLLLTFARIDRGLLRLDHRQRLAVIAPQHVIGVSHPGRVGHADHFVFPVSFIIEGPAGPVQRQVDDECTGGRFAVFVGFGNRCILGLVGGEFFAQRCQLGIGLLELLFLFFQLGLQ